jgi:hypothetical protein
VFALLGEQRRAAHALWAGGEPVPAIPCNIGAASTPSSEGDEQLWYDAIHARLCLAVLDLVIIRRDTTA